MKRILFISLWCIGYNLTFSQYLINTSHTRGGACCCGEFVEIFFPNLDFESPPSPAPGTFITYGVGQSFAGWTVTRATIDHCDAGVGNLGAGNPNGGSFFIDLHGSPGLGAISYNLFGLTPGNQYRIEFWTAQNSSGFSSVGTLKIANGAWLDVSWTVSVSGSVAWRKEMYEFMAMGSSATMEFSSTGPMVFAGTLVDDIHIFECPGDAEKPEVINPPDDLMFECDKDVTRAPRIIVSDNCDPNPTITLKESTEIIDPCTKRITRNWEIKDACGNITEEDQIILVEDRNPPVFTKLPEQKILDCDKDILKEFNDWLKKNGNALAQDACGNINWRTSYDRPPKKYCDTVLVEFIAKDHCGNEISEFANFIVRDTSAPKFIIKPESKNFICIPNARDSLREWLNTFGYSTVSTDCDTVLFSTNFDGDSTKNPLSLRFYIKDRCGNADSSDAVFSYRSGSDTFRITNFSCDFTGNSLDTLSYFVNGCDSIVILQRIKQLADSNYQLIHTCDAAQTKFDTVFLKNSNDCDSILFLEYLFHPAVYMNVKIEDCKLKVYSNDTTVLSGQYCDSIIITEYIPLRNDSNQISQTTCDINKADTSILYLTNSLGCDSIVTVFTVFKPRQETYRTLNECGLSKSYIDTLIFTTGLCDSLVITTHNPLRIDTSYIQSGSCDISKTGTFLTLLKNKFNCDSLLIETVHLNPTDSIFINTSTCNQSLAGKSILKLTNQYGCDSIITTISQFIPSDTVFIQRTTCELKNVRTDTIIRPDSLCDSVFFIHYSFFPSDTNYIQAYTCDKLKQGLDTLLFKGSMCDSVIIRNTQFIPADTSMIQKTSCNPTDAGLDTLHLTNSRLCDSLVYVQTTFVPLSLQLIIDSITCFQSKDGQFSIMNWNSLQQPVKIFLNNNEIVSTSTTGNLTAGRYTIKIEDANKCISQEYNFTLTEPIPFIIDIGNDITANEGDEIKIKLNSNKISTNIRWIPYSCHNCQELIFNAKDDSWIIAQALDQNQCPATDSLFIRVNKKTGVFVANSFSPNGDNINDYFYIQGDEKAIVETLFIYNRWGEKIFETHEVPVNEPTAGWNGNFKAQKMNPGVFLYFAKIRTLANDIIELKGDVTLIR